MYPVQEVIHRVNKKCSEIWQFDKFIGPIKAILDDRVGCEASPHIIHH